MLILNKYFIIYLAKIFNKTMFLMNKVELSTYRNVVLKSALPEKDRRVPFSSIADTYLQNRYSGDFEDDNDWMPKTEVKKQAYLRSVKAACCRLDFQFFEILVHPLDAPIEVLNISTRFKNLLRKQGFHLKRVSDIYQAKITNHCLVKIKGIGDVNIQQLNDALEGIGVPRIYSHPYGRLIYRFHDPDYRSLLTDKEAYLLKMKYWSSADNTRLIEEVGLSGAYEIRPIIERAKKILMQPESDSLSRI